MATYQYSKKWRADIHIKGVKVAAQSGFDSKAEAQEWHDKEKERFIALAPKQALRKVSYPETLRSDAESISSLVKMPLPLIQDLERPNCIPFNTMFWEDLWEQFNTIHLPTVRKSTQVRYAMDVKYRIQPFFERCPLDQISQITIENFKLHLLQTLSPKSTNNCLALLKLILKKGVQWQFLKENPGQHVGLQKLAERKHIWWQNKEDILKFLAVAKFDPYYLAYRLGLECGLRLGEIVGLSKDDINMEQGQIHIHRQWLEKEHYYGPTKHGRERYISFTQDSELYGLFEKALQVNPSSEILFFTRLGNRVGCRKLSGYYFQNLIKKSGVPRIRFHDLRHTFASWYMITTDNIWDLKYLLGHQDIQTTQRYAHLSSKRRFSPDFGWNL